MQCPHNKQRDVLITNNNNVLTRNNAMHSPVACRGGKGGHGPRAQALEGAPAQLVGPNCKKKSRPSQISKVTSLQSTVADAGFTKRGRGGRTPSPEGASRVGLCGGGGGVLANSGGGGADASIGPRALETLGMPLALTDSNAMSSQPVTQFPFAMWGGGGRLTITHMSGC